MALTTDERKSLLTDLQKQLLDSATYAKLMRQDEYADRRQKLLADPVLSTVLPPWLVSHRDLEHFRALAKTKGGYVDRRTFIHESLAPAFELAERGSALTAAETTSTLRTLSSDEVERVWLLALERKDSDPEGALTLARTLLETVIMHILDDDGIIYKKGATFSSLYKTFSEHLNLAPSQHERVAFKAILGNAGAVVAELAQLRNSLGDSHGRGRKAVRIAPRHAALAVNLAGSIASFIVETWNDRKSKPAILPRKVSAS